MFQDFFLNRFRPLLDNSRQNNIDLLRAVAVLSVVIHHTQHVFGGDVPFLGNAGGWFGVQLFFVISGYLIAASAERYPLRDFAIHRFFRIAPAYLFFFLAIGIASKVISFHKIVEDPAAFLINLTFLQHLFPEALLKFNALNVSWTLTVEVIWYAAVPLLLVGNRKIGWPTVVVVLCVSTAWSFAASRHWLDFIAPTLAKTDPGRFYLFINNGFFAQAVFFIFGAWIHFNRRLIENLNPLSTVMLSLVILMAMPYYLLFNPLFITGISISLMLITAINSKPIFNKFVFVISETSYAIYLVHFPAILWVYYRLGIKGFEGAAIALSVTLLLAVFSYALIEKPCMEIGRKLTKKHS